MEIVESLWHCNNKFNLIQKGHAASALTCWDKDKVLVNVTEKKNCGVSYSKNLPTQGHFARIFYFYSTWIPLWPKSLTLLNGKTAQKMWNMGSSPTSCHYTNLSNVSTKFDEVINKKVHTFRRCPVVLKKIAIMRMLCWFSFVQICVHILQCCLEWIVAIVSRVTAKRKLNFFLPKLNQRRVQMF